VCVFPFGLKTRSSQRYRFPLGGESGKGARPCHYEWILNIVEQCSFGENPTPVFVKQLGTNYFQGGVSIKVKGKGGDIHELPSQLQVRKFPKVLITTARSK
jgi:hypothetical protein